MHSAKLGSVIALAAFAVLAPMNARAERTIRGEIKDGFSTAAKVQKAPRNTRPTPVNWSDANHDAASRLGTAAGTAFRAGKTIVKTGGRYALTAAGVAAVVGLAAYDISMTANAPQVLHDGAQFVRDVGTNVADAAKVLWGAAPTAGMVAGGAAAGYIAMPYVKYIGKNVARVWYDGGPGVDIAVGSLHALLGLVATQDVGHALQAGGAATFISNGARLLTPGAAKFSSRLKETKSLLGE